MSGFLMVLSVLSGCYHTPIGCYNKCSLYHTLIYLSLLLWFIWFAVITIPFFGPYLKKKCAPFSSMIMLISLTYRYWNIDSLSQGAYCIVYSLSYQLNSKPIFLYLSVFQSNCFQKWFQTYFLIILLLIFSLQWEHWLVFGVSCELYSLFLGNQQWLCSLPLVLCPRI